MESFFGTMKQELRQHHRFATGNEAEQAIVESISVFYNQQRRHSTLNYVTPAESKVRHIAEEVSGRMPCLQIVDKVRSSLFYFFDNRPSKSA